MWQYDTEVAPLNDFLWTSGPPPMGAQPAGRLAGQRGLCEPPRDEPPRTGVTQRRFLQCHQGIHLQKRFHTKPFVFTCGVLVMIF